MTAAAYIDGHYIDGDGDELIVEDPSSGKEVARLRGASLDQVEAAIAAGRAAFRRGDWRTLSMAERAVVMHRFIDAMQARSAETIALLVSETGCPPHSGSMFAQFATPIQMAHEIVDLMASLPETEEHELAPAERKDRSGQPVRSVRRYSPLGVVAGISAYNFPLFTGIWKIIPALAAGNSVVLRPNPLTPLSSMAFAEAAEAAALPKGVLNIVIEPGIEGAQLLTTHPDIDMVTFTGSSDVGRRVAVQAAASFKAIQLELGGKSAHIFLPDSAEGAITGAMVVGVAHAGQGCTLATRFFVPEDQKAAIVERAAAVVAALRVGRSGDPETQVGPVISAAQGERCERFVKLAVENGARVAAGGKRPAHLDGGYFFEPTVLDLPDNSNPAAQEEIFGPVACIIGYRDLDHAIEMANDSKYGLAAYVSGKNRDEALAVADRLESGTVHVNGAVNSTFSPFGGIKASGVGLERGVEGMRLFQRGITYGLVG